MSMYVCVHTYIHIHDINEITNEQSNSQVCIWWVPEVHTMPHLESGQRSGVHLLFSGTRLGARM